MKIELVFPFGLLFSFFSLDPIIQLVFIPPSSLFMFMHTSLCCVCALMLTFPFTCLMGSGDYTITLIDIYIYILTDMEPLVV